MHRRLKKKKNGGLDRSLILYENYFTTEHSFPYKDKTLKALENLQALGQGKEFVVRQGSKSTIHKSKLDIIDKLDIIRVKAFPLKNCFKWLNRRATY